MMNMLYNLCIHAPVCGMYDCVTKQTADTKNDERTNM